MMRILSFLLGLVLAAAAGGCTATPATWLHAHGLESDPRPDGFAACTSFACFGTANVALSPGEWNRVRELFDPPPLDAAAERAAAARAVGLLEEMVGARVGTAVDRAENLAGGEEPGQLDCIAEASNTTAYLLLLERDGLLPRHRVAAPAHRGFLVFLPHTTAVLEELVDDQAYALDSWYGANGETARVWPLAAWRRRDTGWDVPGLLLARQAESEGRSEGSEP